MDDKQKGLIPELGDSHMSHSWAPQTPAKPGKIKPHQICTEPQNYEALHTIRVESDEFLQKNQMGQSEIDQTRKLEGILQENMDACLDSENAFEIFRSFSNWEAYKAMETQVNEDNLWGSKIAGDDGQMPFLELLAKVDNRLSTNTSGNCSLVNNPGDGSCLSINLNLPSNFFEVAPITPEKTMRNDGRRGLVMQNLSPDAIRSTKDMQQKEIHTERVESEGILQKKEQSQLVTNDISEANSMQLEENHKPDKGGTEDVDLSKTPQQKPRRRKHRPKVIIEGQSQKTPKRKVGRPPGPQGTAKGKRKGVNNNPATATPPETIDGKHTNANNAPSSQETTTAKRKYVRRNTKATTPEAEIKGKDTNSNVPSSQETTTGKRKYVKRKEVNKPTVSTPDEETRETTEPKIAQKTRTTCKRSLNFDIEVEVRDESSLHQNPPPNSDMESQAQNFNAKDQSGSNTQYAQVSEGTLRKTEVNSAYDLTFSTEQEMEGYLSKPKGHSSSPSHRSKTDTLHDKSTLMDQKVCTRGKCPVLFTDKITPANQKVRTRGKCQILFTDKTVDGEGNSTRFIMKSDAQSTQKSPSDSGSSSTACLTEERIERGQKRQHTGTTVEAEPCRLNLSGTLYNSMQAYNAIFPQNAYVDCIPGMHFPAMYSTKRIEKVQNSLTSSMHSIVIAPENRAMAADDDTQNKQKRFKYLSDLGPTERLDKGKSKEPAPVWNLESLPEICGQLQASAGSGATTSKTTDGFGILQQPQKKKSKGHTHDAKAITVDASARTVTKKRPKKSLHINSTVQHMHADHHFVARSMGPPLAITWMCNSLVDAIALMTEQFNQLDLNAKSGKEHDAFTANYMDYQEQHALVPYQRNGALIPFDGSFDQVKRSRPRPKVDIDDETSRVWKLLLENINNEGIDGTDEEKEKWWEEERRVFRGRADSFIARMHLVQGDRRFSPWKGSVLDSVVGVFLTQNVSDHLSSSAFMSLAARFPFESESSRGQSCREKVNITINGPEVHDLDTVDTFGWNEGFNKPPCSEVPKMLDNDTGEVNNFRFPGENFIGALPKDKLSHQLTDISKNAPDTSRESAVNKIGLIGDEKDLDDTLSSQNSVISSQNSADSVIAQSAERPESCSPRTLEAEPAAGSNSNSPSTSDQKPSQNQNGVHNQEDGNRLCNMDGRIEPGSLAPNPQNEKENLLDVTCSEPALHLMPTSGEQAEQYNIHPKNGKGSNITDANELCESEISGLSAESAAPATIQKFLAINPEVLKISSEEIQSSNARQGHMYRDTAENPAGRAQSVYHGQENNYQMQEVPNIPTQNLTDITGSSNIDNSRIPENTEIGLNLKDPGKTASEPKAKGGRTKKEKPKPVDWDNLRKQAQEGGRRRERTANTMDSVDWEAVRCAHVSDVAETIKERGMNNVLAGRIQDFLNRLVRDHGSTDLEWLRDVPPDKAKEYLLSVRGLGLKSVECVRLLTLHHLAFPVDTNVGRIVVRLGWVPLQPLPESLQLHLLELYPVLESIQQYLWPRLCKLDQRTLYELHYQMITFGKVFCTKSKPNCNACPMRGECRHFASAFASARLALPGTEDKSIMSAVQNNSANQNPVKIINPLQLPLPQANQLESCAEASNSEPIVEVPATPEPIIEVPASPEPDQTQAQECDIEDNDFEDPDDIPTIQLNMEQFTHNLQSFMQNQMELQEGDMSKALVALTPEAASIPVPKLKNVSRLRTEHQVYELPDAHPLLQTMDKREPDDPCSYLLAIWTPGETADSIQPPEGQCSSQDCGNLCTNETCFSCNSIREGNSQTVRGTLLIPCRTAMRGSFPLNGTYFQVNEVFADHESSLNPINVPREWLWNLPRRTVYFGTSIPTIFKGLSTEGIQYCFWRGFVCVRGFDSKTRAPRPLIARLHFPASKLAKAK